MSQAFRAREPGRRTLLARIPLTEQLLEQLHDSGQLDVVLSAVQAASWTKSLDGSGAVLALGASGQPARLLLDDYVDPEEDRAVHFAAFTLWLRWRDEELLVHAAPGTGGEDPWSVQPAPSRSKMIRSAYRDRG